MTSLTRYDPSRGTRRQITLALVVGGTIGGALFGLALTVLGKIVAGAPPATLPNYLWNAQLFAVLGAFVAPTVTWASLRHIPLWRSLVEPAAGAVLGAGIGVLLGSGIAFLLLAPVGAAARPGATRPLRVAGSPASAARRLTPASRPRAPGVMPIVTLSLHIDAPPERCFDLTRSIDLHRRSTSGTGERAVAGVTTGLIGPGDEVTWEARHFGVRQRLTSRITAYDRPHHFRDSQVRGAFRRFDHDHRFAPDGRGTLVTETFDFEAPLGVLGRVAERVVLTAYMRRFLAARNAVVRAVAESDEWRRYLPPD